MDGALGYIFPPLIFSIVGTVFLLFIGSLLKAPSPMTPNTYMKWASAVFLLTVFLGAIASSFAGCTIPTDLLTFGMSERTKVIG